MGKILGSWSGMRKYLEEEMLVDSLSGILIEKGGYIIRPFLIVFDLIQYPLQW